MKNTQKFQGGAGRIGFSGRRRFLLGTTGAVGLASLPSRADISRDTGQGGASAHRLTGELLLFGYEGRLKASRINFQEQSSILTRLRLSDGDVLSTKLPMARAHMAEAISDGLILCVAQNGPTALLVDASHRVIKTLTAPDGFLYSGHGLIIHSKNIFALPLCRAVRRDGSAQGAVEIYGLHDFKLLSRVSQWGINPHELRYLPERDEIVVSDYGTLTVFNPPVLSRFGRPSIFTCDSETFAIKRVHEQTDLKGAVTHLRVTEDGSAYFVLQQSVLIDTKGHGGSFAAAVRTADQQMARLFDFPERDYPLPYIQYETPEMSVPTPLVRVNLDTGERALFMVEPRFHIRPQSVELNALTGTVVASYTASDSLVLKGKEGSPYVIDGALLGVNEIRGLADIVGTPYVAVSGSERNVAVVDVERKELVARYRTRNFVGPHMSYNPVPPNL